MRFPELEIKGWETTQINDRRPLVATKLLHHRSDAWQSDEIQSARQPWLVAM